MPAGLPSDLLQRRPDLVQAEQELAAATARIGVPRRIDSQAEHHRHVGCASPQLSRLVGNETAFGVVGPGLVGPLLNAQILGFQQDAAEAQGLGAGAI